MKKLLTITIATLLGLAAHAAQDTLYVMDEGALVTKRAITDIDSMTFDAPANAEMLEASAPMPKYIFLFIGDGLASPQVNMGELAAKIGGYAADSTANVVSELYMTQFPVVGMQRTHASNRYITGSAASATALATGYKTSINTISQSPDHSEDYKTIAEMAKEKGMKVGIISSVSIDHATPACFYSHSLTRNYYNFIAGQMADSDFDYFGGGWAKGYREKYQDSTRNPAGHVAVTDEAIEMADFTIASTRSEFDALAEGAGKVWAYTSMGDGSGSLPYTIDYDEDDNGADIYLSEFTAKGIELMKDCEEGFFIMVEGGKIDWACHANDVVAATANTIEFDNAIGKALEFYNTGNNADSTLIIVTGDHETGGLTIGYGATKYETALEALNYQSESYEVFDDRMSSWTSADIGTAMAKMTEVFGLGDASKGLALTANEQADLAEAFYKSCSDATPFEGGMTEEFLKTGGYYNAFTMAITHILNKKAGIAWTSYSHTAVPVPVFAIGAGADCFTGYYENTEVARKIARLADFNHDFPAE